MTQILWSFEKLRRFTEHPDLAVRDWALERLTKLFPDQAGETAVKMLDDENIYVRLQAVNFLGDTGDKKYGPVLLEKLKQTEQVNLFVALADALGQVCFQEAGPVMLDYILQEAPQYDRFQFYRIVRALEKLGGDEVRQRLRDFFEQLPPDDFRIGDSLAVLLKMARPEEVSRLVKRYQSELAGKPTNASLFSFAEAANADGLYDYISYSWQRDLLIAMGHAGNWLEHIPQLSDQSVDDLTNAFEQEYQAVFEILRREAHRIFGEREDDLAAWRAAWEAGQPPVGYRREAVLIDTLLEAFAAQPSPDPELREEESIFGLSLLFQLSADRDDEGRLEAAADKTRRLFSILTENREHVLPGVVERVVNLGPDIAPRLIRLLRFHDAGWQIPRLVEAIWQLARQYPGSCDGAVLLLISLIHEKQRDDLLELCSDTLSAIGPVAVPEIARHLQDDDMSRRIYLTGALGDIPTEESAQAVLARIESTDPEELDEMYVHALGCIGSASTIEPLYQIWQAVEARGKELGPDEKELARTLLILCQIHDAPKTELPKWRQIYEANYQ